MMDLFKFILSIVLIVIFYQYFTTPEVSPCVITNPVYDQWGEPHFFDPKLQIHTGCFYFSINNDDNYDFIYIPYRQQN
jgi:hypothetical protein